jgi:6-phosphogluconolactonase
MTSPQSLHWQLKHDAETVARSVAKLILQSASAAIADHGSFRLVLAGGTTPRRAYEILADCNSDWSRWYFYYGDERCLPVDHEERNSVMVQTSWLDKIQLGSGQHFPMAAELGPQAGAEHYRQLIENIDAFDLVLLGMGEDGHTASLFPNQLWQPQARVLAVEDAPKPPPQRVSLGPAVIHQARQRCFVVTGDSKADAVAQWRQGADLPIARAALDGDPVIIDQAAWGEAS